MKILLQNIAACQFVSIWCIFMISLIGINTWKARTAYSLKSNTVRHRKNNALEKAIKRTLNFLTADRDQKPLMTESFNLSLRLRIIISSMSTFLWTHKVARCAMQTWGLYSSVFISYATRPSRNPVTAPPTSCLVLYDVGPTMQQNILYFRQNTAQTEHWQRLEIDDIQLPLIAMVTWNRHNFTRKPTTAKGCSHRFNYFITC